MPAAIVQILQQWLAEDPVLAVPQNNGLQKASAGFSHLCARTDAQ